MTATYIHERPDWPQFRWDESALGARLAALRHRQGRLIGRMEALGFRFREEAVLGTIAEDVLKSSEIEGERLDSAQVRSSVARRLGVDIGALTPADREVEGVVEMALDATQHYAEPLTADRLRAWHAALFPGGRSGLAAITTGAWRTDGVGPMQVVSGPVRREKVHFEAPAALRLEAEMTAFLNWFETEHSLDPVLKAGLAHLWFVTIHPFDDGNGRVARAITDMALARSEQSAQRFYSMSAQIRAERNAYYQALETTQKGELDVTAWLVWFFDCLDRAFERSGETLSRVLDRARFWERHTGASFNPRQLVVLNRLMEGFEGKLTSSKWAVLAKCSPDTALRDIDDLMARGILRRDAAGGRSTSYSLVVPPA